MLPRGRFLLPWSVLDFGALALASVLEVSVLVSVLTQDQKRDQDNLQGKMQHCALYVNHCNTNTKSKVHLMFLTYF